MKPQKAARRRKRPVQTPPSRRPQDRLDKILLSLMLVGALYLLFGFSYRFVAQHAAFFAEHGFKIPTRSAEAQSSQSSERIVYLHTDHVGRPVAGTDEMGQVVYTGRREPFGEPQESGNDAVVNVGFSGQHYDKETGLYYNYYRHYDPPIGRYLQPDPTAIPPTSPNAFGVVSVLPENVRSALNLMSRPRAAFDGFLGESPYPYVNNNPLRSVDPTGLFPQTPKDSITTRIESLIGRGRVKELRDFLFSHEDDFPPQVREKLLKQCRNILDRKAKKSANALRTNNKYNEFFHRTFKKDLPKGVSRNRDATPEELVEAFEQFFRVQ